MVLFLYWRTRRARQKLAKIEAQIRDANPVPIKLIVKRVKQYNKLRDLEVEIDFYEGRLF